MAYGAAEQSLLCLQRLMDWMARSALWRNAAVCYIAQGALQSVLCRHAYRVKLNYAVRCGVQARGLHIEGHQWTLQLQAACSIPVIRSVSDQPVQDSYCSGGSRAGCMYSAGCRKLPERQ
jgi:hypothetical protein